MWTVVICLVFGILLGIALTLGSWIGYDKIKGHRRGEWFKQMTNALNSDFCDAGCGYKEDCQKKYGEFPEIMQDELEHNYCFNCPIRMAQNLLDDFEE